MSGRAFPLRPERPPRLSQGCGTTGPLIRPAGPRCAPWLLVALLCLVTALGASAAVFPESAERAGDGVVATVPFGPPADALEARGEAGGDSGCHGGGDEGDAPRAAVLPGPEQPAAPAHRPTSVRHESGQGLAPLGATAAPDASAVDLYRTRVIRT